jgi:hypothetical protein
VNPLGTIFFQQLLEPGKVLGHRRDFPGKLLILHDRPIQVIL